MNFKNLENKLFFHLDKFSKTCRSGNDQEVFDAFKETAAVRKELKKYHLTAKLYKDHPNATPLFDSLEQFSQEIVAS